MAGIWGNAVPKKFLFRVLHAVEFMMILKTFIKSFETKTNFHATRKAIVAWASYFD